MNKIYLLPLLCALSMQSGCISQQESSGYTDISSSQRAKITPQQSHKQDVLALLGSPSSTSLYGGEVWYYISQEKERIAFLRPEIVEQTILAIHFTPNGLVSKVERHTKEDAQEVAIAEDITPTEGNTLGLWDQLLGNLGKFNKNAEMAR